MTRKMSEVQRITLAVAIVDGIRLAREIWDSGAGRDDYVIRVGEFIRKTESTMMDADQAATKAAMDSFGAAQGQETKN